MVAAAARETFRSLLSCFLLFMPFFSFLHSFPNRTSQIDDDSNDEADSHTTFQNNSLYDSRCNTISVVTAKKIFTLPSTTSDDVQ